jgi:hypothetical protein
VPSTVTNFGPCSLATCSLFTWLWYMLQIVRWKILLRLGWTMRTCRTFKRMTCHAPMNCVPYMSTTTLLSFNMKKNPWFCCIMKQNLKVLIGDKLHQNIASKKFFNLLLFISNIFGLQYFLQNHKHFKKINNQITIP